MANQKNSIQLYCDMCGNPIVGKGVTVVYEGSTITVCSLCYSRIRKASKPASLNSTPSQKRVNVSKQKSTNSEKRKDIIDFEIISDYSSVIRSARENKGMTTKQLAEKLKTSESIIKRIEQGKLKPTLEQAKLLERILSIKLIINLENTDEKNVSSESSDFELTLGDIVNIRDGKK
ncbi:multiprotein bridging factor aMBF1 [Candidatus Acidianus copahuensis]|nr:multiprotein bridging factor aMBF1 [Candidatus Acidianus copahuensis]